jgi:small-conductance mechanosensitive channel
LIRGFGDSSVDLEIRVWITDPQEGRANVTSELYLRLWKLFRDNDISIPFPQRDLHLRSIEEPLVRDALKARDTGD